MRRLALVAVLLSALGPAAASVAQPVPGIPKVEGGRLIMRPGEIALIRLDLVFFRQVPVLIRVNEDARIGNLEPGEIRINVVADGPTSEGVRVENRAGPRLGFHASFAKPDAQPTEYDQCPPLLPDASALIPLNAEVTEITFDQFTNRANPREC